MEIAISYMFMSGIVLHALGFCLAGWVLIAAAIGTGVFLIWYGKIKEERRWSREKWERRLHDGRH